MEKGSEAREGEDRPGPSPPASAPPGDDAPETMDWETRFKYLLADFDNFRRRTDRERAGTRAQVEAALLRRLLPLIEGIQSAEESAQALPATDPFRRGLELLEHELATFLRSIGFSDVARVGEPFRPEEHEAVGETRDPHGLPDGAVAEIVQQGYRFQGGLLRPAKVLVSRTARDSDPPLAPPEVPGVGASPVVEERSD